MIFGGMILGINSFAKPISSEQMLKNAQKGIKSIGTKEIQKMLKKNPNIRFIDVRTKDDILKQGGYPKVNRYTNIQRGVLEFLIGNEVDENEVFVVHCYTGNRSLLAAKQLKKMGYKNVIHYKDSFAGWQKAGLATSSLDRYPNSMLYSKVKKVAKGVYISIGETSFATYANSGHNNNLGFIVGKKYVLVWNAGANYLLAKSFHEEIKKVTNKKVKYVLLENSQGHAMLGSSYWQEQGAKVISQEIAKKEIKSLGRSIFDRHAKVYKDKNLKTKLTTPNATFKTKRVFDLGGRKVEALYFGYAHEHSDIALWLPKEKILFAGDLAFNQRLLPIFKITQTDKWLEAWEKLAKLKAKIVIPGHGDVTNMKVVTRYTKDYLVYLRKKVLEVLDNDGGLADAYNIDQSAYEHLDTYKELAKQNVARLFKQLEFE
jgi:rhodanese-related sulfurtransferase/glyoxylase-like metal-dependent hydrolase (beta-lactamase superfamily II)